jgi:hypothetical protein
MVGVPESERDLWITSTMGTRLATGPRNPPLDAGVLLLERRRFVACRRVDWGLRLGGPHRVAGGSIVLGHGQTSMGYQRPNGCAPVSGGRCNSALYLATAERHRPTGRYHGTSAAWGVLKSDFADEWHAAVN